MDLSPVRTRFRRAADELLPALTFEPDFDEDKCRNVLVRYCAHIPRNYQYRDGVRLVFLVLRDHLGDENLGKAGGVLYEMIEVDCQHSFDPGAAFQRWRHSHMLRHANLELPHVPHLTTISTAITPTATLTKWRADHPQRYQTRLSDHSGGITRSSTVPGCVRHRKSWAIDYTTFVSSRDSGTRPLRQLSAREFHEMHWNPENLYRGRFVEVESLDLSDVSTASVRHGAASTRPGTADNSKLLPGSRRHSTFVRAVFEKVAAKLKSHGRRTGATGLALVTGVQGMESSTSFRNLLDTIQTPRVNDWDIPNAAFARKFGLLADGHALPPSIKELPVAEDKAVNNAGASSTKDIMRTAGFQGPFTPQLWFDGGLDYRHRWK